MSIATLDAHPVPSCVRALESALDGLDVRAWDDLDPATARDLAARLARVQSRIAAHAMAAARVLDRSGAARRAGESSTGDLLARDFGGDRRSGDALVRTARRIEAETTRTESALARGEVSSRQADVIATGMANLPSEATPDQRDLAERALLRDAQRLSLKDLRSRADRLTDVYKPVPEVDADEDTLLRARDRAAREKTRFRMWDNHDGTHTGQFTLPDLQAAMLKTALDALAAPHQSVGTADEDGAHREVGFGDDYPKRLGHAFASLVELLPTDRLPSNGGVGAVVTVNLDLDTLMGGLKAAGLSDGRRISASEARRLACGAQLLPMVLGGDSLPLDLGSPKRYFNRASRRAMEKRDGGCTAPGCDRDTRWCEAHHLTPYAISGETDIRDGALLCTFHHHRVHDQHWSGRISPTTDTSSGNHPAPPPGNATTATDPEEVGAESTSADGGHPRPVRRVGPGTRRWNALRAIGSFGVPPT